MIKNIFTWDLGATKCTAGLIEYDSSSRDLICKKHVSIKLAEATSLANLIDQIESGIDFSMSSADAICIGAAGCYNGETLILEKGYPYPMQFAKIANERKWPSYAVIHDYAPIVCATFTSYMQQANNVKYLNTNPLKTYGRRVALGIGTGLGLKDGVLFDNGDFWLGQNEIGHIGITIPPSAEKQHLKQHEELIQFLQSKSQHGPITFEKILSGSGIVRLHQFFYPSDNDITPEQVGAKMREGKTPELSDAFAWYIGLFVGTVQLSFMPEGGVWITGGVALNHLSAFDNRHFFAGIHASPTYLSQREEYPLGVLCNHEHALIGCGYYASRRLLK